MSGILLAIGHQAETTVARGLTALARRSHHRATLWSSRDAAIAFSGEHGGLAVADGQVAAVDGEILLPSGILRGREAAAHLLDLFDRHGSRHCAAPGQFSAALWESRTATLTLVTRSLGARPLYLAHHDNLTLAASELKALIAAGVPARLDLDGAAQLLAYEHLLGARTMLAGVRQLPPGHTTIVNAHGEQRFADVSWYRASPRASASIDESVGTFGRLLDEAVRRRCDGETALALSGGLDSRCLAAVVARRWPGMRAFTFGSTGSEEIQRASTVGRLARLDHAVIELELGYVARDAAETVWLSEGQIRCFHAHHLALRRLRERHGVTALLAGYAGDYVARAHPLVRTVASQGRGANLVDTVHRRMAIALDDRLHGRVLRRAFASELAGRARSALDEAFAELEGPPVSRTLDFSIEHIYRRKVVPGIELFADDLVHRDPYLDEELLAFLARIPVSLRLQHALQLGYLRRHPELAHVPNPKSGLAPALVGPRLLAARVVVKVQRTARRRSDRLLRQLGFPPRSGYSDYASHLRGEDGSKTLGILLEERTLDRGQIRADAVRDLVRETIEGRAAHTQVLGVLLTLELFQRQFVDGDGFGSFRLERIDRNHEGTGAPGSC